MKIFNNKSYHWSDWSSQSLVSHVKYILHVIIHSVTSLLSIVLSSLSVSLTESLSFKRQCPSVQIFLQGLGCVSTVHNFSARVAYVATVKSVIIHLLQSSSLILQSWFRSFVLICHEIYFIQVQLKTNLIPIVSRHNMKLIWDVMAVDGKPGQPLLQSSHAPYVTLPSGSTLVTN